MSRPNFKKEYVDNFEEIQSLYESGVSLSKIHKKLTAEGKITGPLGNFKNLHVAISPIMVPKLRNYYKNQVDHYARFVCVTDSIAELMKEGHSAEKVFAILSKAGEITMSLRLFRTYSQKHGLILRAVLGTSSPIEHEFLQKKDIIVRRIEEGKNARSLFDEMHESGELKMSFSTFRGYCFKHGVEMKLSPAGRKRKKAKGSQPEELKEQRSIFMNKEINYMNSPAGLTPHDTLDDALSRADLLSSPDGSRYSEEMNLNRDARRIVLLAREYRRVLSMVE